jgi:predicted aspartyl protease
MLLLRYHRGAVYRAVLHLLKTAVVGMTVAALSAGESRKIKQTIEIPFKLESGLIWVEVMVNSAKAPLKFIFDTGAAVSALDRRRCKELGLSTRSTVAVAGIGGMTQGMWPVRATAILGEEQFKTKFVGVDLAALSKVAGSAVDGIIGADVLKGRMVKLDFKRQLVTLGSPGSIEPGPFAETIALKKKGNLLLVPVRLNGGNEEWFRLDTGCTSLHWANKKVAAQSESKTGKITGVRDALCKVTSVEAAVGTLEMRNVEAVIHSTPIFPGEAGLLGMGYLTNFTALFDFKSAHMFIENHSYHAAVAP